MSARELRNQHAGMKVQARSILDKAESEKRGLTPEEREQYDALLGQISDLAGDIKRAEQMETLESADQQTDQRSVVNPMAELGMTDKEIKRYSLVRAIRAAAGAKDNAHSWDAAGLEREASDAVAKRFGRDARSFFVPFDIMIGTREQRDLSVGTPTAGGYTVATQQLPLIQLLRNRLILSQAGIRVLTGLVGDVSIPKHTAAGTAYWVAEGGDETESQQGLGQVAFSPHTIGAFTDITRRLLMQSSLDVESFVRDDLALVLALGIDFAGLHGNSGVDPNQPDGIAVTSGIGSVVGGTNGASPDWADVVDLESSVAVANAEVDSMAYVTNSKVRGKFKKTFRNATYGEIPIWDGDQLNGHRALVSNQVSSTLTKGSSSVCSGIFYGNWADLVLGIWGDGLDILVDPYTLGKSGGVRVVAFEDVDFGVRQAASFAAMLDALTA